MRFRIQFIEFIRKLHICNNIVKNILSVDKKNLGDIFAHIHQLCDNNKLLIYFNLYIECKFKKKDIAIAVGLSCKHSNA